MLHWSGFMQNTILYRSLKFSDVVTAVLPVANSKNQLVALINKKICLVDRDNGIIVHNHVPNV